MADYTSSRYRSRRKSSKRPTSSKTRATRSRNSKATVTQSGQGSRRGSAPVTRDSRRTSTGNARVTSSTRPSLPPGKKGGAMTASGSAGVKTSRGGSATTRTGPMSNRGRTGPRGMRTRLPQGKKGGPIQRALRTSSRGTGPLAGTNTSGKPDGRYRMKGGKAAPKGGRMGPLSGLVAEGASRLLNPLAETAGYEGGKAIRKALGGGNPTRDKKGNRISPNPRPRPGVNAPGRTVMTKKSNYAGPGGNPDGSGQGQARRSKATTGLRGVDGKPLVIKPSKPNKPTNRTNSNGNSSSRSSSRTNSNNSSTRSNRSSSGVSIRKGSKQFSNTSKPNPRMSGEGVRGRTASTPAKKPHIKSKRLRDALAGVKKYTPKNKKK